MPALPPDQPTSHADAGDGVEISVNDARSGARSGRVIWILVISLALVTVALLGLWALKSGDMSKGTAGAQRSMEGAAFNAPQPSPKQAPPDMPSTTGQTTPDASNNSVGR